MHWHAAADPRPAQRADETDDDHEPDRAMDIDEERDFADQSPLTDMDMEEDAEILSLLLKYMPSCIDAADIEQLVQEIPMQPPVVVPVRTVQEPVAAGDLPPLDADAAIMISYMISYLYYDSVYDIICDVLS